MRFFKKYLPDHHTINKTENLKWIKHWLVDPQLWHFNRRSVSKGVAVGLFFAMIPLPVQMLLSAIFAILFRANVPVAIVMTWVTNPFTMLPIIYIMYKTGAMVTGDHSRPPPFKEFSTDLGDPVLLWHHFLLWMNSFGKNFFIGLPIVAIVAAIAGFILVHLIWRIYIFCQLIYRYRKRS